MVEIDAYNEALSSGRYQKPGGLLGKYDNVRRFWEDEQLGLYLRPYLERLVARKEEDGERLRVMDLGCGSGDGFELLSSISNSRYAAAEHDICIIQPAILGCYKGVDINDGLLKQARAIYVGRGDMAFVLEDMNHCSFLKEPPYDLYLATYGTLSHNTDEQTVELLSNIARHSRPGAIIMVDWLGRYSYEWQTLWTVELDNNQWMDYVISYLSTDGKMEKQELTSFPLRIMGREEVERIYRQVGRRAGGRLALRLVADRSSLVGRHIDTAQYNPHCQPIRCLINRLFEINTCTNLDELLVRYVPSEGFTEVNAYYQNLAHWWDHLVDYTKAGLGGSTPPEPPGQVVPSVVRRTLGVMKKVLGVAGGTKIGNPRASLVEPQLAYCLRELEMGLQQGLGCGHGLVAIFEVREPGAVLD